MPLASPIASHPQVKELIVTPYCQFLHLPGAVGSQADLVKIRWKLSGRLCL